MLEFWVTMHGAWSNTKFEMTSILYVDDTDLLHMSADPSHTTDHFV